MQPLYEKYTPFTLNGIVGNKTAIAKLEAFGSAVHNKEKPRPIIIFGPSGTGKTTAARALAYANGFEVIELGASDYRDAKSLTKKLLPATVSKGLFSKTTIIIFDEIDELSVKFDAGAEAVISQIVKTSRQPLIFIANDYWSRKIAFLREKLEQVEFKKVPKEEIHALLKSVLEKEGKQVDEGIIDEIAKRNNGDIRGALNDLEMMIGAKPELLDNLGVRDRRGEIFGILDKIFTSADFDVARTAANTNDISIDMLFNWVNENVPNRYASKSSISEAYDNLAKASMFLENAERTKYYGYMRYSSVLLSSGVAVANRGINSYKMYTFPANIKYLSRTKKNRNTINEIAKKLIAVLHAHKRDILNDFLPLLKAMIEKSTEKVGEDETMAMVESRYGLDKDEVKVILDAYKYR